MLKFIRNVAIGLVLIVALALLAAPLFARFTLERVLLDAGAEQVDIDGLSLNLLRARVELTGLVATVPGHEPLRVDRLYVDVPLWRLFNSELQVTEVALSGVRASVVQQGDQFSVAGLQFPADESDDAETDPPADDSADDSDGGIALMLRQLQFDDVVLRFANETTDLTLTVDRLRLADWSTEPTGPGSLKLDVDAELTMQTPDGPLEVRVADAQLNGEATVAMAEGGAWPGVELDGSFQTQGLTVAIPERGVTLSYDALAVPFVVRLPADAADDWQQQLVVETGAELGQLAIDLTQPMALNLTVAALNVGSVRVAGINEVTVEAVAVDDIQIAAKLGDSTEEQTLTVAAFNVGGVRVAGMNEVAVATVAMDDIRLAAQLGESTEEQTLTVAAFNVGGVRVAGMNEAAVATVAMDDIRLAAKLGDSMAPTLTVATFNADGVRAAGTNEIVVDSVAIADYQLTSVGEARPVSGEHLKVSGLSLRDQSELDLQQVWLSALAVDIQRDADGAIVGVPAFVADDETTGSAEEAMDSVDDSSGSSGTPMLWRVNEIGFDALDVRFRDDSVAPPFTTHVTSDNLIVGPVSNRPSAPDTRVAGRLLVDDEGSVILEGVLRPFDQALDADLAVKIDNVELVPLSPYVVKALGYHVRTGKLDADLAIKVVDNQSASLASLKVDNITFDPASEDTIERINTQLTVPLDVALSTIRDEQKNIRLDIPVTGDISDPDFDLDDAIQQATVKATQMLAISFLKTALEPYTTMINVAELAYKGGKKLTALKLDPVVFTGQEEGVAPESLDYLTKVQQLLTEHPALRVSVCGVSYRPVPTKDGGSADSVAQVNLERLELAKRRAKAVKSTLVELGADGERLFACQAKVIEHPGDAPAEQSGHVDLVL